MDNLSIDYFYQTFLYHYMTKISKVYHQRYYSCKANCRCTISCKKLNHLVLLEIELHTYSMFVDN